MKRNTIMRPKVSDFIIEDFRRKLKEGVYKEGDKLPDQETYARSLGVSRPSVREAFAQLQAMGAISLRQKIGTLVTCGDPDRWIYPISSPLLHDSRSVKELLEARKLIEGAIGAHCAEVADEDDIMALEALVCQQSDAYADQDSDTFWKSDTEFHLRIVLATKNRFLYRTYMELFQITKEFIRDCFDEIPQMMEDALIMHQKILEAIGQKDGAKTASCIQAHIRVIQEHYANFIINRDVK